MTPFIDMHCDTLTQANLHYIHDLNHLPAEQLDVKRLRAGGAAAQFFAICLPKITTVRRLGRLYEGDWKHIRRLAGILRHTCDLHADSIALCKSAADLEQNRERGRISAVLTIEDGRQIEGRMERLAVYHRLGVRLLTLTWNYPNCFGYPGAPGGGRPTREESERGLTAFGREAVEEMNRLGMLIDVSHLSDGGFFDVARLSRSPFVASHSNCRALCDHPRNLTDEMIRMIALSGGVVGMTQVPAFLVRGAMRGTKEDCLSHLRHLRDVGGIDCVALGSDFDGCGRKARLGLKGPQEYPSFAEYLLKEGFTQDEVEKIFYKNVLRVFRDVLQR